ncbi:hypothetical protein [Erythrobacter sp. EC-HK427]|uniref:hypothetical protein n=1 Tax=Erythrobacter sp. EC-HK427 TaxID=2038396 RepID=UPI0012521EFB|nr:hypothetical protein [Erythrobacter sp. EC-HK427]VVT05826.1 membrane hypothetical protein [Erythrobacter sp. EC-HK427]
MASVLEFLQTRDGGDWVWLLSLPLIAFAVIWWPLLHYRFATWRLERKLAQRDMLFADERIELAMSVPAKPEPLPWKAGVLSALLLALLWFALEFVHWRGVSAVWVFGPLWCWFIVAQFYLWCREGFPAPKGIPPHVPQILVRFLIMAAGLSLLIFIVALLGLF